MDAMTPMEDRNGLLVKRDDLYVEPVYGINGAKFRAARYLMATARERGIDHVITGGPVAAPTLAIVGYTAREAGLRCTVLVSARSLESALTRKATRIAYECGATVVPLGAQTGGMRGPTLRKKIRDYGAATPGALVLEHGITVPDDASKSDVIGFLSVGAEAVHNLPDQIETLVLPFGSGNSAAGVLYGLWFHKPAALKRVVLIGISSDHREWLARRLAVAGCPSLTPPGVEVYYVPLHPHYATYPDQMPFNLHGIELHPTYEGKIASYLEQVRPPWWTQNWRTCLWIVGGPF